MKFSYNNFVTAIISSNIKNPDQVRVKYIILFIYSVRSYAQHV
jgi:predicted RNA-binding protein YlqC (UPF0109 family)